MKNSVNLFLAFAFLFSPTLSFSQDWLNSASRIDLDSNYYPFFHGVASGDPLTDRVIIWTRVTQDTNLTGSITVNWRIATDTNFTQVINSGTVTTTDTVDYTVKVDVSGLQPGTWYYYDFYALGTYSLIGRTKTAPTGDNDSVRFAVVSCSSYEHGYFNAYERIASRNDVDAILHLGDYIYEYAAGAYGDTSLTDRDYEPTNEILTLTDYRTRLSHYHLDPDLRFAHQQYPWITVWDDHETANNSWMDGAENHDSLTEGNWADRKSAAVQAYFEWLPIRQPNPNNNQQIYRKISYGNLLDLLMIDTRLEGRDEPVSGILVPVTDPVINDTTRSLLGADQYNWLVNNMDSTNAQWKIIGQQVMMAPMEADFFLVRYIGNPDQWDGYQAERNNLLNDIMNKSIDNVVVLTGDIHTSWANDIPLDQSTYDPSTGAGSVAVEFVTTSVTSASFDFGSLTVDEPFIKSQNPHVKFVNLSEKGYLILDINKTRTQSDWYYVTTVSSSLHEDQYVESWYVNDQERFLNGSSTASVKPGPLQPHAPLFPPGYVGIDEPKTIHETVLFGVYPNPFNDQLLVKYYIYNPVKVKISLIDVLGRTVVSENMGTVQKGLHYSGISTKMLAAGNYILLVESPNQILKRKIVKQ